MSKTMTFSATGIHQLTMFVCDAASRFSGHRGGLSVVDRALSSFRDALANRQLPKGKASIAALNQTVLAFSFFASTLSMMDNHVETSSSIPLEPVYGSGDRGTEPPSSGTYPFTRGNFASGYRGKLWTFRQYFGFGTVEASNRRYRYLLEQGGTGLSVALNLPTPCGFDSDVPEVSEEVGRVGVAVDTLADRKSCSTAFRWTRSAPA